MRWVVGRSNVTAHYHLPPYAFARKEGNGGFGGGGGGALGGAIFGDTAAITIQNSTFTNNTVYPARARKPKTVPMQAEPFSCATAR